MNDDKLDWYLATQTVATYLVEKEIARSNQFHKERGIETNPVVDHLMGQAATGLVVWAVPTLLKHIGQNQLKGKIGIAGRLAGRAGMRFVPFLGTALLVKDIYDIYDYFVD